jgi:hypothetical protein
MTRFSLVNRKEAFYKIEIRENSILLKGKLLCQIRHEKSSVQCENDYMLQQFVWHDNIVTFMIWLFDLISNSTTSDNICHRVWIGNYWTLFLQLITAPYELLFHTHTHTHTHTQVSTVTFSLPLLGTEFQSFSRWSCPSSGFPNCSVPKLQQLSTNSLTPSRWSTSLCSSETFFCFWYSFLFEDE